MDGELTWNGQKKEFWKLNVKELQAKLQELETQKVRAEMKARGFMGDFSFAMHHRRLANTKESHVDLKGLRHKIACIKTILHVKLKPHGI